MLSNPEKRNVLGNEEANLWGMLCHLAALSVFVGVPLGNIIGPIVISGLWRMKVRKSEFVERQGKASLNFQLSILIYGIVSAIALVTSLIVLRSIHQEISYAWDEKILIGITWFGLGVSGMAIIGLVIFNVYQTFKAGLKAWRGENYQYPLSMDFV